MKYIINSLIISFCIINCLTSCGSDATDIPEDLGEVRLDMPDRFMVHSGNEVELELKGLIDDAWTFEWMLDDKIMSKERKARFIPNDVGEKQLIIFIKKEAGNTKVIRKTLFVAKSKSKYQVVGYYPYYRKNYVNENWNRLTHVIYCFARVNSDGSLEDSDVKKHIQTSLKDAHIHGIPALLSIGGGGNDMIQFCNAILNKDARANLVKNCLKLVSDLKLDGLDIDFEGWDVPGKSTDKASGLALLCEELRKGLPKGHLLTAALSIFPMENGTYRSEMINSLDYVNVMSYDSRPGYPAPHAPFDKYKEWIQQAIDHLPKSKILPGLPFYGIQYKSPASSEDFELLLYKNIVDKYPGAENKNEIENKYIYYDGKELIRQKCEYALQQELGGVMIWEITQDTNDQEKSLLTVMDQTMNHNSTSE